MCRLLRFFFVPSGIPRAIFTSSAPESFSLKQMLKVCTSRAKIQLSHDFKHDGRDFFCSLLLKVCMCVCMLRFWGVHAHVAYTRRRTQAMMQFSMPDLDASSAHSAICLKINQNELNFDEKVIPAFSYYNDSF